jgi:hypothetical protein
MAGTVGGGPGARTAGRRVAFGGRDGSLRPRVLLETGGGDDAPTVIALALTYRAQRDACLRSMRSQVRLLSGALRKGVAPLGLRVRRGFRMPGTGRCRSRCSAASAPLQCGSHLSLAWSLVALYDRLRAFPGPTPPPRMVAQRSRAQPRPGRSGRSTCTPRGRYIGSPAVSPTSRPRRPTALSECDLRTSGTSTPGECGLSAHPCSPSRERPYVDQLRDPLVRGHVPVARVRRHADEHRTVASLPGLHRRRELVRVPGHHAVVVVRGGDAELRKPINEWAAGGKRRARSNELMEFSCSQRGCISDRRAFGPHTGGKGPWGSVVDRDPSVPRIVDRSAVSLDAAGNECGPSSVEASASSHPRGMSRVAGTPTPRC